MVPKGAGIERRPDFIDTPAVRIGSRPEIGHGHGSEQIRTVAVAAPPQEPIRRSGVYQDRLSAAIGGWVDDGIG